MTPIVVPIYHSDPRCPNCDKIEDKKEVCKHCGYEYPPDSEPTILLVLAVVAAFIIGIWMLVTLLVWLGENYSGGESTLLEILRSQWDFVRKLRVW